MPTEQTTTSDALKGARMDYMMILDHLVKYGCDEINNMADGQAVDGMARSLFKIAIERFDKVRAAGG